MTRRCSELLARVALPVVIVAASVCSGGSDGSTPVERLDLRVARRDVAGLAGSAYPGLTIGEVRCPRTVERAKGVNFSCTVVVADLPLRVKVAQVDRHGTVVVGAEQAVVTKPTAEQFVAANSSIPATVDCGPEPVRVMDPGQSFSCTAQFADGTAQTVELTVNDVAGNVTIAPPP